MIYTTYFAKLKHLPKNIIPISICGKAPVGYKGLEYKKLAPKYDFFMEWKRTGNNDYYIKCFNEQVLDKLDALKTLLELSEIAGFQNRFNDICLVCYEKPSDFCHRHLVSNWFNKNLVACEEWYEK